VFVSEGAKQRRAMDHNPAELMDKEGLSVSDRTRVDRVCAVKQTDRLFGERGVSHPYISNRDMDISKRR
jgi:hypothetical protein